MRENKRQTFHRWLTSGMGAWVLAIIPVFLFLLENGFLSRKIEISAAVSQLWLKGFLIGLVVF